ncbi:MAG: FitA-like ribbon-helix-helix domain-containing protein [Bryobacteraceae bacterium]
MQRLSPEANGRAGRAAFQCHDRQGVGILMLSDNTLESVQTGAMPTLHIENVPEDLYEALLARARDNGTSISAEVLTVLEENVSAANKVTRRKALVAGASRLQSQPSPGVGPFPSSEEMLREDRAR